MKKVEIEIPDDCILVQEGDKYVIKKDKPRSWEEFCERYPVIRNEYFISSYNGLIYKSNGYPRNVANKNYCTSEEEAEAFLALMQLRRLRKAWVGDWKPGTEEKYGVIYYSNILKCFTTEFGIFDTPGPLSFPTEEIAEEFLSYFKDLCETAKILL